MVKATKGRKLTPEHRAKLSAAMRGKRLSLEHRAKLSMAGKGRKHSAESRIKMSVIAKTRRLSPETKAKLSIINKGKKLSQETKNKISAAFSGCKHPNWEGGISGGYSWDFTPELREEIRSRDNYKCQLCNVPQLECRRPLNIHHIDYDKKNSDPLNLIALCHCCHARTNWNRKCWQEIFASRMVNRTVRELERQRGR